MFNYQAFAINFCSETMLYNIISLKVLLLLQFLVASKKYNNIILKSFAEMYFLVALRNIIRSTQRCALIIMQICY